DTIYFGGYADHYDGGSGYDILSFATKTTGWTLREVDSPDTHDVEEHGGTLGGFEKIVGSPYADTFWGGAQVIDGGGGNDHLAMQGADASGKMYGGAGNDTIGFVGQE